MTDITTDTIAELDDRAFRKFVTDRIFHDADPAAWDLLLSGDLLWRTGALLTALRVQVEGELCRREGQNDADYLEHRTRGSSGRADWLARNSEYQAWRRRAVGFKRMVERRQLQAKEARRAVAQEQQDPELKARVQRLAEEADHYRDAVRRLAVKVHEHQALTASSGRCPEQHDYDLWRLLDELTVLVSKGRGQVPLRRMLQAYWFETTPATVAEGRRAEAERLMRQAPAGRSARFEGVPRVRGVDGPKRLG